jgi:hypothetical protein
MKPTIGFTKGRKKGDKMSKRRSGDLSECDWVTFGTLCFPKRILTYIFGPAYFLLSSGKHFEDGSLALKPNCGGYNVECIQEEGDKPRVHVTRTEAHKKHENKASGLS